MDKISHFSAPGRTEIGGNHTDHNHGRVLAGSVNLDGTDFLRFTAAGGVLLFLPYRGMLVLRRRRERPL